MPVPADQAIVPHRLQLSTRSIIFCCACFLATAFGASVCTISFSLVLTSHAGSPEYWAAAAGLFVLWSATLLHMYRLTVAAILLDR